jgi:hypothetical protein
MRELRMVLVVLFVALPLAAAAQAPQWVVRDLEGAVVGPVLSRGSGQNGSVELSDDSPLLVARRIPGKWIQLLVSRNAVWATKDQVPFLFEDYDCSGPAFLETPPDTKTVRPAVVFDTEVFWPRGAAESRVIRAKGVLVGDPARCETTLVEPGLCCTIVETEETRLVAEVSRAAVANLHLRPPFRLERLVASSK